MSITRTIKTYLPMGPTQLYAIAHVTYRVEELKPHVIEILRDKGHTFKVYTSTSLEVVIALALVSYVETNDDDETVETWERVEPIIVSSVHSDGDLGLIDFEKDWELYASLDAARENEDQMSLFESYVNAARRQAKGELKD